MKTCSQCRINYPDALDFCPQDGNALPPTAGRTQALYDTLIGHTVDGRYLIEAKLGEGGMGVVYAGRHVIIDKRVAIKVLKTDAQEEETAGQRFIQEAKSASKIGHANIVDITDFGMLEDGSAYFVMEFLEGRTLGDAIRSGPIPARRVISIGAQMARALNAAHGKGIIHRDLKPENIFLLERDGQTDFVKIVDFGIAKVQEGGALGLRNTNQKLTQAGMVLGTPEYMSPEQATGKETDHRLDEYALGCIMYEMLTGDVPYRGESSAGTLTKHVFETIVPPRKKRPDIDIPPTLDAIVVKAMAKKPDDRYPSMKELLQALDEAGAEIDTGRDAVRAAERVAERSKVTVLAGQVGEDYDSPAPARSKGAMFAIAGAGVLVVGALGAWLVLGRGHGEAAENKPPVVVAASGGAETPAPVTKEPVKAPQRVALTLRSTPAAEIYDSDGKLVGMSPQTVTARPGAALVFTFKRSGYQDLATTVVPDRDQEVPAVLVPAPKQHSSSHSHPQAQASARHSPSTPAPSPAPSSARHPLNDLRDPFRSP